MATRWLTLADPVHLPAAAGALQAVWLYDPFEPRQILGQVAAVAPDRGRLAPLRRLRGRLGITLRLDLTHGNFEILEGQLPVVLAELLGLLAMHHMVQLGHQVLEARVDLFEHDVLAQQRGDGVALVLGQGREVERGSGRHGATIP